MKASKKFRNFQDFRNLFIRVTSDVDYTERFDPYQPTYSMTHNVRVIINDQFITFIM